MLAVIVHEREPLKLGDLPGLAETWLQDLGLLTAAALAIWGIAYAVDRPRGPGTQPSWLRVLFQIGLAVAGLLYAAYAIPSLRDSHGPRLLIWGAAAALATVLLPFLYGLTRLRPRRVLAIAILCFKEALRSKVLWVSAALVPFFLFADWFLPQRPESQLKVYIEAVFLVLTVIFLVVPIWLAALSIPADIRLQTIHTVVTKPVERFEVVLGRFLGYVALMTMWLLPLAALSLLFVWVHGVHPDAAERSLRARVPLYGNLRLMERLRQIEGGIAREWEYRRYISGGPDSPERAVWEFPELPARLEGRSSIPCEFSFDIFRTRKGEGASCSLVFQSWRWQPGQLEQYRQAREAGLKRGMAEADVDAELARQFGYYEVRYKRILDYHTYAVDVPAGLFQNAAASGPHRPAAGEPLLMISVKCEDRSTYVGVAKHDLYFLDAERSFVANLFKGTVGLWFCVCLVIGLAVAFSTYFSGIISFVLTLCLYLGGLMTGFIRKVVLKSEGVHGPAESFLRLVNQANPGPLDESPVSVVAQQSDEAFRVLMGFVMKLFPDVDRFSLTSYVAEGFDIAPGLLLAQFVVLLGYLGPALVLAYYLLNNREIGA